ncbi:hypothetical protein HWV62_40190 [Athelia sp. TMB]|nr:hypothetical protein HWV62_40190 [Athelia sp. TMB]
MGGLVSSLMPKDEPLPPKNNTPQQQQRPTHISFSALSPAFRSPPSSPSQRENPFERPLLSPALTFYTAPSTPLTSPQNDDPPVSDSPPEIVLHVPPPPTSPNELPPIAEQPLGQPEVQALDASPALDDAFPNVDQVHIDPSLDEEGLSNLEKIYLFSRSQASFHRRGRVYIMNALPEFLEGTTPAEAVGYVMPLLSALATDPDEQVAEALASRLVPILWWFYTHCEIVEDEEAVPPDWDSEGETAFLPVQAFTPILGTLLLSPNAMVGGPTRFAVVDILSRIRKLDEREDHPDIEVAEEEEDIYVGTLAREERRLLREELLQQVVIGIGRLDMNEEGEMEDNGSYQGHFGEDDETVTPQLTPQDIQPPQDQVSTSLSPVSRSPTTDVVNPYFPAIPSPLITPSLALPLSNPPEASSYSNAHLRVSFAQLPVAPSLVASYQDDAQQITLSPDPSLEVPPDSQHGFQPEPPVLRQDSPERQDMETDEGEGDEDDDVEEQAAAGRLSSMSLIAAVVASGPVEEHTRAAFVSEVERVGQDQVYWVRREASFALGALAKIVPHEVVVLSLVCHAKQRRSLALETMVPLAADESAPVRLGVLEALGEVLHTFREDEGGPPEELLRLFMGRPEDRRLREEKEPTPTLIEQLAKHAVWGAVQQAPKTGLPEFEKPPHSEEEEPPIESFYKDPSRPLICAFNYPAVALTLGRQRWNELVDLYQSLAKDDTLKVRRTLSASLGEMAKIIGPDFAKRDLLPVWRNSIQSPDDGETRLKAIEAIETFVNALDSGNGREEVPETLLDTWRDGKLEGWRERRCAVGAILPLARAVGEAQPGVIIGLLKLSLADSVAGVREEAISILPQIWALFENHSSTLRDLELEISTLAHSPSFRGRMTYIASQQGLVFPGTSTKPARKIDAIFWRELKTLASDPIIGVRITLARFVGLLRRHFLRIPQSIMPDALNDLVAVLSKDDAKEVRSFVADDLNENVRQYDRAIPERRKPTRHDNVTTFSRPPPSPSADF